MPETLQLENWRNFPKTCGVYMQMKGIEILYIGSTSNLRKRFSSIEKRRVTEFTGTTSIIFHVCNEDEDYMRLEKQAVRCFQPVLNTVYKKEPKPPKQIKLLFRRYGKPRPEHQHLYHYDKESQMYRPYRWTTKVSRLNSI